MKKINCQKLVTLKDAARECDITRGTVNDLHFAAGVIPYAGTLRSFGGKKDILTTVESMMRVFGYLDGSDNSVEARRVREFVKRRESFHKAQQRQGLVSFGAMTDETEAAKQEWEAVCAGVN